MNNIWSENIQGVKTLYLSRKLRFDDMFFEQYKKVLKLKQDANIKILEIGCGPGALAEALCRWYPNASITALDRDSNFISFAKKNIKGVNFIEGDASNLPFDNDTFDVTISNTVQEHIDPNAFWGEQYRVLKKGGICICLSARKGIQCRADCLKPTEEENKFWENVSGDDDFVKYGVGKYSLSEAELPAVMEKHGFSDINTGYAVIDLTPDDPKYPAQMAETMIESMRQNDLEAIRSVHCDNTEAVIDAVNKKYDTRLRFYREGIKLWDTSVSLTMILRGIKP